ncbi:MAG: cbb3-type cytochrome oxidase assembly protein CcoS [Spirosomataceae bacterium]
MTILYFMIGTSLLMALGFLSAFLWAQKTGQNDDLYTPSIRILLDDSAPDTSASGKSNKPKPNITI